jgi:hypothetical protein
VENEKLVALLANVEIRIESGKAIISGLPANLQLTFVVKTVGADGQYSLGFNVPAKTAAFAATKIKSPKAQKPTLNTVNLETTAPKVDVSADYAVAYQIVVSYKVGKVIHYAVLTVNNASGEVSSFANGTADDAAKYGLKAPKGGSVAGMPAGFEPEAKIVSVAAGTTKCRIEISGLPQAGTKFSFALTALAENVYGTVLASAIGKTNVSTVKFPAPKSPVLTVTPPANEVPGALTFTWKSYAVPGGAAVDSIKFFSDKKGTVEVAGITVENVAATATGAVVSFTGSVPSGDLFIKLVALDVDSAVSKKVKIG